MKFSTAILAGALALSAVGAANATITLVPDTGWEDFSFVGVGQTFSDDFQFTITQTSTFKITDAYADGDQFAISINGGAYTPTSVPTNDGTNVGVDYDAAYASPKFSHAAVVLGSGTYDITGEVLQSPYGHGDAVVELITGGAVPEPTTWALMLMGFGAIGSAMRRRTTKLA
jgi:hypothetical protein